MRVLITGGTGLIGRALASALVTGGHEAWVTSRRPERVEGLPPGVAARLWNAADADQLAPLLEGVDAVVHLAGESIGASRWTAERKRRIRNSRVNSTEALAKAFALSSPRPKVLVQGSAVGYYGPRGDEPIPETAEPGSDFLAQLCQDWEAASVGVEALGVRRLIARTGVVFAVAGGALPRIVMPFKLLVGGPVGSGNQVLPWIHLHDEVGALVYLLEDPGAKGVFNLAAPRAVSNRELARVIGRVLQRPSVLPTPAVALRLLLGEMSTLVLDGQRAVPKRLLEGGFEFQYPEIEPALKDLIG